MSACYHCEFCIRGEHSFCRQFTVRGQFIQGGDCEFVAVPRVEVIPIPDSLTYDEAASVPLDAPWTAPNAGTWDAMVQQLEQRYGKDWFSQMQSMNGMMNGMGSMLGHGGMTDMMHAGMHDMRGQNHMCSTPTNP